MLPTSPHFRGPLAALAVLLLTPSLAPASTTGDAAATAEVAAPAVLSLDSLPDVAGTALASFDLHSPEKREGGAYFGAVDFLGSRASAVLHPVQAGIDEGGDGWILSIDATSARLSDLIPTLRGSVVGRIGLRRTAVVLATSDVRVDSATMTDDVEAFYGAYFRSARPMLEVARGINLLTRIETDDGSPLGSALDLLGIETEGVLLQGTVLKDASFSDLNKARKDKKLRERIRDSMELRAYLPTIDLDGLPDSYLAGETSLIVNAKPGVGLAFRLVADGGTPQDSQAFECRVDIAQKTLGPGSDVGVGAPVTEVQIMGTALGVWEDAFGLTGFDLEDPRLLLEVDSAQRVGFGVRAGFNVGSKEMDLAAKLQLHAVTGAPVGGFFEGRLNAIGSGDLVALANAMGAARGLQPIKTDALPDFELRDLYLKIAPTEGDSDLGTSEGFALRGHLYAFDTQLAFVDGSLSLSGIVPDISLQGACDDIDLGAVALKGAAVDIRLGMTLDQHFRLKGSTKLLALERAVDVDCSLKGLSIDTSETFKGVYATSYHLSSPAKGRPSWKLAAEFENQLSKTLSNEVSGKVSAWADETERKFRTAQRNLDVAKAKVREIDGTIEARKHEVQVRRDKQGAVLRKAQAKVAGLQHDMDKVRETILAKRRDRKADVDAKKKAASKAEKAWKKARQNRKSAPLHKRPKLRIIEAKKFADYQGKNAAYLSANAGYKTLLKVPIEADARMVALRATKETATGALKAAEKMTETWPIESDPQIVALFTGRTAALAALDVARGGVFVGGKVTTTAAKVTAWVTEHNGDVFMIDSASFDAQLAGYLGGNEVTLEIEARFLGKRKQMRVRVAPSVLVQGQLTKVLWSKLKKELEE